MPVPPGFSNIVRIVSPVTASDLNTEISAQNAAGYWLTDIKIMDSTAANLLFGKYDNIYPYPAPQKVHLLAMVQATIDADAAAELPGGYVPTGLFLDPTTPGNVYVLYQLLVDAPA